MLYESRGIRPALEAHWIHPDMKTLWAAHRKRYSDLQEDLESLFYDVNVWLGDLFLKIDLSSIVTAGNPRGTLVLYAHPPDSFSIRWCLFFGQSNTLLKYPSK